MIAVLSDTHSRHATVEQALALIEQHRVDCIIHCGDIEDADTVWLFPPNTHFVFGNCDVERASLRQAIHGIGATLHEPFGRLEIDGKRIAFIPFASWSTPESTTFSSMAIRTSPPSVKPAPPA